MPTSLFMPDITAEIAMGSAPDASILQWVDVSDYVEAANPIGTSRGRSDELTEVQPSRLTMTLDNSDGRFTPGNASSPYYPNVKKSRRIRVNARWPLGQSGNMLSANAASMETSVAAWITGDFFGTLTPASALAQSALHPQDGTNGLQITWPTTATPSAAWTNIGGLAAGRTYTASAYVWVPAGAPDPRVEVLFTAAGTRTSTKNALTRISVTFVATQSEHSIAIQVASATAGQLCFVDAAQVDEGSTVGTFTLNPPPIYRRLTAYVDEWPVVWPTGTDQYSSVTITASSRQARLAVGAELPSIIETEILTDAPRAYYPLGDPPPHAGSPGQAGDVSGNQQPSMVSTGTGAGIQWQEATGPGTDSLSAPLFSGGKYLGMTSTIPLVRAADTSVLLECFFNTSVSVNDMWLMHVMGAPNPTMHLRVASDGTLRGAVGTVVESVSATTVDDGLTHHAALRATISGGNVTTTLYLDGTQVDTDSTALAAFPESSIMEVGGLTSFGGPTNQYTGTISHAAVFASTTEVTNARILAHAQAGLTGFVGDSTDERIVRLAGYAGIPVAEVDTEPGLTTSILNQDTTGRTPTDLMQEVTDTEGGILFDAGNGDLVFQARTHRYNAASQYTLDAGPAEQHLEATLEAKLDGQQLVNDITATGGTGITVRVINQASIDQHGIRRDEINLLTTSDNEVYDAANWRVQRYAEPDVRITSVEVDLINQDSALITQLLATELGTRITLGNLPVQAPASSMDFFVDGINESIGAEFYTIGFELTPVGLSDVWQLDSASYSQLGETTVLAY